MATWVGILAETRARSDFWEVVARFSITALDRALPDHVLINCGTEFERVMSLAKQLSEALQASTIGFVVQTNSDVHQIHAFRAGELIRQLDYSRDEGGWVKVAGAPQDWERAYFFGEGDDPTDLHGIMFADELAKEDVGRYEAARRAGDASHVLDLLNPSSTEPMIRVCASLGADAQVSNARWSRPSFWSRLLARRI